MRYLMPFLALMFRALPVLAQDDSLVTATPLPWHTTVSRDACTAGRGMLFILGAPARWDASDWGRAGFAVLGTGGAALLDDEALAMMQRNRTPANTRFSDIAVHYGEGAVLVPLSLGLYGTGLIFHDTWLRETALLSGTALLLTEVSTRVLKVMVGRARPYAGEGNAGFHPFSLHDRYNSFPSGHTAGAFAFSAVLAARIDRPWVTVGLYSLATLTAFSRMYSEDHWFSDVFFNAIFCSFVGRSLVLWHEHVNDQGENTGLRIVPNPQGLMFVYQF